MIVTPSREHTADSGISSLVLSPPFAKMILLPLLAVAMCSMLLHTERSVSIESKTSSTYRTDATTIFTAFEF